jgi:drug/metabolite transporter (DMT)-like permease
VTAAARRAPGLGAAALGYALVALAACSWGAWPLILRPAEALAPIPPALESTIAMTVLTLVSAPVSLRDRVSRRATRSEWLGVAWLGVADAMNVYLFFAAYQRTSVAVAVLTHYLTPIFIALTAPLVLGERADKRTFGAVGVAFVGLVLLLSPWDASARPTDLVGAALGAGSAVFYTTNVLVTKRLVAFSASELMFFHGFVAIPILAALVPHDLWWTLWTAAGARVGIGAIGPGALAGLFFVWGLRRIPASHASTLTLLEPLIAVVLGAVVYGERLGPLGLVGGALILAGAAFVIVRPARPAPTPTPA